MDTVGRSLSFMPDRAAAGLIAAVALAGCIAWPATRTYFEPDPADGTPTPSGACGWQATRNDALLREVDGLRVQVAPRFETGRPLAVTVLVESVEPAVDADPGRMRLRTTPGGDLLAPSSARTTVQEAARLAGPASAPVRQSWSALEFPVTGDAPAAIGIEFGAGAVRVQGRDVPLAPFRFRRVTRRDWYYGSPNC